jgi:hypothetical protein
MLKKTGKDFTENETMKNYAGSCEVQKWNGKLNRNSII